MFQFEREQSCNLYLKILKVLFIYLFYIFIRQPIQYSSAKHLIIKSFLPYLNGCDATFHYTDVIMSTKASQITSLTIVYSTVYSGADQRKHQSSASLAFVRGIHRWPVNSQHKRPVTRKIFPFDDVIMCQLGGLLLRKHSISGKILNDCAVVVFILFQLDHRGLVTHIYVRKMSHHSFR